MKANLNRTADMLMKMGKRLKSVELVKLAMDYGVVTPQFTIVKFDTMENMSIRGRGRFSATSEDSVQTDIAAAQAFARFLSNTYGASYTVNHSRLNNILQIEIKCLRPPGIAGASEVIRHLESVILNAV